MGRKPNPDRVTSNGDHWNGNSFVHYGQAYGLKLVEISHGEFEVKHVQITDKNMGGLN